MKSGSDGIRHNLLNLHDNISFHVDVLVRIGQCEVPLHLLITKFIAWLILSIIFRVLLDGIIDQVNELIMQIEVLVIVLLGAGTDVAIPVKVCLKCPVVASHQRKASDIKLPALVQ
jgi:hypothetical protein